MRLAAVVSIVAIGLTIVSAVMGSLTQRSDGMTVYETSKGEHRSVLLEDGSQVHLGARTGVTSNFSAEIRLVVLDRGEATFNVTHNAKRPFRVFVGRGMVTAIGTSFNIRRLNGEDIVSVTDGTVEVSLLPGATAANGGTRTLRVSQGQEVRYDFEGRAGKVHPFDPDMVLAWREGFLKYETERLDRVMQDVNRYSGKTVTITDAAAAAKMFSGTVFERNVDDWINALEATFPDLQVTTKPGEREVIVQSRTAEQDD